VKNSLLRQSPSLDQSDDEDKKKPHRLDSPPPPPSPKFRTLLPGEKIDFAAFQQGVHVLQDQCERLMGSLEESRRKIDALTAEKDHYKEFWLVTNNYHSLMSRFQVPAPTTAITASPFPAPLHYSSSLGVPQFNAPPYPVSGYPVYSSTSSNRIVTDSQAPQSQQEEQPQLIPVQEPLAATSPIVPEVTPPKENPTPSTPEPAVANNTQSPDTPSKPTIASYFASAKKPVPLSAIEDAAPHPSEIDPPAVSHDADTEAASGSLPLDTPSKSRQNMSTSPEDLVVFPTEKEPAEHPRDMD